MAEAVRRVVRNATLVWNFPLFPYSLPMLYPTKYVGGVDVWRRPHPTKALKRLVRCAVHVFREKFRHAARLPRVGSCMMHHGTHSLRRCQNLDFPKGHCVCVILEGMCASHVSQPCENICGLSYSAGYGFGKVIFVYSLVGSPDYYYIVL